MLRIVMKRATRAASGPGVAEAYGKHIQASKQKHPLAEKLAIPQGRGKKIAAVRQEGAVQKKQTADNHGTTKRAQAVQAARKAATTTPSPKRIRKAVEAATVTPAKIEKAERIRKQLEALYPNPPIPLVHKSDFQLLIAVMLSAQTTDKKVNEVTPALFAEAPCAETMAARDPQVVEGLIKQVGLAPTKSKNVVKTAQMLVEKHSGMVPKTFEELEELPGVGHKTASVVMAQCHGVPAFPVDTHIHRLAERWGLSNGQSVERTEADLKALFSKEHWNSLHLQIIYFGREHCPAKQHDAAACPICMWARRK